MNNVIFDTNAYLDLVDSVSLANLDTFMQELIIKEQNAGFIPLIHPVVLKEILSHLYKKTNASRYELYLKANKAVYCHGLEKTNSVRIIASVELQLARCFWKKILKKYQDSITALLQISLAFNNSFPHEPSPLPNNLKIVYEMIEEGEKGFVDSVTNFLKQIDPSFDGVRMFSTDKQKRIEMQKRLEQPDIAIQTASAFLYITEGLLLHEKEIQSYDSNKERQRKASIIIKEFPEVIELQKWIYKQCFSPNGLNIYKNRNFVWDIHLMFSAGNHSSEGNALFFVTSDKAMLGAAKSINSLNNRVLDLVEYKRRIGLQP